MLSAYQTDVWELADPESYLREHRDKRVILDEIKRAPDRIAARRGLIDEKRHKAEERGNSGKMMDSQKPDLPVSVKRLGKKNRQAAIKELGLIGEGLNEIITG